MRLYDPCLLLSGCVPLDKFRRDFCDEFFPCASVANTILPHASRLTPHASRLTPHASLPDRIFSRIPSSSSRLL